MTVDFVLNGSHARAKGAPDDPAWPHIDPNGARDSVCADGLCLQCAVLLGERVVPTCILPLYRLEENEIRTRESLRDDPLYQTIMRAFDKVGISRCGDSLNALVMLAYQLLSENSVPSENDLQQYSRYISTRCISRDEFERAVRLAGRVHKRRSSEHA